MIITKGATGKAMLLCALGACSSPPPSFRVVLISDTHVPGPQYVCCHENGARDNASIQHAQDRLATVIDRINAITPPPDMVVVTGDIMHDPYYSLDPTWYATTESAWTIVPQMLARLTVPVYLAWGNHDYNVHCDGTPFISREQTQQLFLDHYATAPYYAVDHKGWRFVFGNSMLGATWDATDPKCNDEIGSYGAEQLAWIDSELADNLPTIFLSHYPQPETSSMEVPGSATPDLATVLAGHKNVVAHLAGHNHAFLDFNDSYPYRHIIVGGTRYDADNFWLIELDANGGFKMLDYDKTGRYQDCSETWSYDGTPRRVDPQPPEDGDC